jgi:hypothetical protein
MAISVSSATHVQGNDKAAAQPLVAQQYAAATRPQQTAAPTKQQPTDTVQISAAAQALQESAETSAQTTREAGAGDVQAQRLLAKQSATHVIRK